MFNAMKWVMELSKNDPQKKVFQTIAHLFTNLSHQNSDKHPNQLAQFFEDSLRRTTMDRK